jgi:hypothetical protein
VPLNSRGSPSPSPASNQRPARRTRTALRTTNMLPPHSNSRYFGSRGAMIR